MTDNPRIRDPRNNSGDLHVYYYKRKRHLNARDISEGLDAVAELLAPLTELR